MHLHRPQDQLAGSVWLPRFAHKARLSLDRQLPFIYQLAFGSRFGVDGYFLRHFGLSIDHFLASVRQSADNAALARWFLALSGASPQRISEWNRRATVLGAKGHPGYLTHHLAKWLFYPKSVWSPVGNLLEAIDQDEH